MNIIDFLGIKTSRLVVGGNPFHGYSYINDEISRDSMLDYYTMETIIRDLKYAETLGYTTFISTTDDFTIRMIRQYRNEGGTLQWIAQTHPPSMMRACVNIAIEGKAVAIFLQGSADANYSDTEKLQIIGDNLEEMRRANVPVGISTHVPEHIGIAEENFNVDFYMACLHNMHIRRSIANRVSSSISGLKDEKHEFIYGDREIMLKTIRELSKPCIAFKILGGGNYAFNREDLKRCFLETYSNIKPNDIATVGIFQRDKDQLKENALLRDEVLSELSS